MAKSKKENDLEEDVNATTPSTGAPEIETLGDTDPTSDSPASEKKRPESKTSSDPKDPNETQEFDDQSVPKSVQTMEILPHHLALASVSRSSYGQDRTVLTTPRSRVRSNKSVVRFGSQLNTAVFKYLRGTSVKIPATVDVAIAGYEGSPLFGSLPPELPPELTANMVVLAHLESRSDASKEVQTAIREQATSLGIPKGRISEIIETAAAIHTSIIEAGVQASVLAAMQDLTRSMGKAFFKAPSLEWSTVSKTFDIVRGFISAATFQRNTKAASSALLDLLNDPGFAHLHSMTGAMKEYPLAPQDVKTFSLFTRMTADVKVADKLLPTPYLPSSQDGLKGATDKARNSLNVPKDNAEVIEQAKFWGVTCPLDDIDLTDAIATVMAHDTSYFPVNTVQVDLGSEIRHRIVHGGTLGIPRFPYPGRNLYEDDRIKQLLGLMVIARANNSNMSALHSRMEEIVDGLRPKGDDVALVSDMKMLIGTAMLIIDSVTALRNTLYTAVLDADRYSHQAVARKAEKGTNLVKTGDAFLVPHDTISDWVAYYERMTNALMQIQVSDSSPGALFSMSRLSSVGSAFDMKVDTSFLLVQQDKTTISKDGATLIPVPVIHQATDTGVHYGSSPVNSGVASAGPSAYFEGLRAGTLSHSLYRVYAEDVPAGNRPIDMLIRHVPIQAYSRLAAASYFTSAKSGRPSIYTAMTTLIDRTGSRLARDLNLTSLRAAILGIGAASLDIPDTDITDVVRMRTVASQLQAVAPIPGRTTTRKNKDGSPVIDLLALKSNDFIDTGSSRVVFIFDNPDPLMVEAGVSLFDTQSFPFPLFAIHEEDSLPMGAPVTALVDPVPQFVKNKSISGSNGFYDTGLRIEAPSEREDEFAFDGELKAVNTFMASPVVTVDIE